MDTESENKTMIEVEKTFVSTCKACQEGNYYKWQCEIMTVKVPNTLSNPINISTHSYNPTLRKNIIINAGDELKICGICIWERNCYHSIVINDGSPNTFDSWTLAKFFYDIKLPKAEVPEHFSRDYEHYCKLMKK